MVVEIRVCCVLCARGVCFSCPLCVLSDKSGGRHEESNNQNFHFFNYFFSNAIIHLQEHQIGKKKINFIYQILFIHCGTIITRDML